MNQDIMYAFEILGKGMLSLFVVMAILMIVVTIFSKLLSGENEDKTKN